MAIEQLSDGWFVATCDCGWISEEVPGPVEAQDEADEHECEEDQ